MKTDFKTKFLQHVLAKREEGGFTLIELLVVIIIIGILSAIALPSFLNQANKAKQSEAKTYVGSVNRAQQAYYLEKGSFSSPGLAANAGDNAKALGALGLGVQASTEYYNYFIQDGDAGQIADTFKSVNAQAQPKSESVKAYVGGVQVGTQLGTGEATTLASLCEAVKATVQGGANGTQTFTFDYTQGAGAPVCPDLNADPTGYAPVS